MRVVYTHAGGKEEKVCKIHMRRWNLNLLVKRLTDADLTDTLHTNHETL